MVIPKFTAEFSCYPSSGYYKTGEGVNRHESAVYPAQARSCWLQKSGPCIDLVFDEQWFRTPQGRDVVVQCGYRQAGAMFWCSNGDWYTACLTCA
jgi:hypothetical protein